MALGDHTIHRIYTCDHTECQAQIAYKEKVSDKWRKVCPFCKKHSLVLTKATLALVGYVDTSKDKTLGSISDSNRKRKERETGEEKQIGPKVPFWRKNRKIDFNILKNPNKYIETGKS